MTALEAAEEVLWEAGKPLRIEEITKRALAKRYWQSSGRPRLRTLIHR